MKVFYWTMAVLILGTFIPSVLNMALYAATGSQVCLQRAKTLWNISRVFSLAAINILIWGHVLVALWHIWF
jgi:cytochrome b561